MADVKAINAKTTSSTVKLFGANNAAESAAANTAKTSCVITIHFFLVPTTSTSGAQNNLKVQGKYRRLVKKPIKSLLAPKLAKSSTDIVLTMVNGSPSIK